MGTMPVEGPETTMGLQIVETEWWADMTEPNAGASPDPDSSFWLPPLQDLPPCGELGRCQEYGCPNDEVPEVLETGVEYNVFEGWYYFHYTAGCYDQNGDMTPAVGAYLYTVFKPYYDDLDGTSTAGQGDYI